MRLTRQLVLAVGLTAVIGALTYTAVTRYVVRKAEENLQNILLSHRSFHDYIQQVMHPAYYKAKSDGQVDDDFYAPQLLSSSYIIRVMHGFFNQERGKLGLPLVYYKLASNNPRNPLNIADQRETSLIKLFNERRDLKDHTEIATIDGKKYLLFAKPFLETNQACLRCHGRRSDAPIGLQRIYSGQSGFNESIGTIRAIESIRIPLDDEFAVAFIATTASLAAALILMLLYLFNLRLRQRVRQNTAALEQEIEERRAVQEALAISEENYRHFTSLTSDYVHRCTRKGEAPYRIQWIAGALNTISGYGTEEMIERGCWLSIVHPEDKAAAAAALERLRPGDIKEFTFRIIAKDRSVRWISDTCHCEQGETEDELVLFGAGSDITERMKTEELLQFTRVSVNAASDAIFWITPDARVVDVNMAACRALGYTREELLRLTVSDIDPAHSKEAWQQHFQNLRSQGALRFETSHRAKDGRLFPVEVVANYVRHGSEERNCAIVRDITEHKQMEDALRASTRFNQQIINSAHEGIIVYGTDLRYQVWNPFMEGLSGIPAHEVLGKHPLEVFPFLKDAGVIDRLERALTGEIPDALEFPYSVNGRSGWTIDSSVPLRMETGEIIGVIATVQEITERRRAEEERLNLEKQLLHAQKLESLGVLAGGIAHDFNNILTSIVGNTDLALLRLNPESPVRDNLQRIEQAATRAADLAKQMLAYSGKGKFVIEPINLNRLVEEMTHMLEVSISKKAVLRFNFADSLPTVDADATQLRQIIMNLVINASEAIGNKSGVIAVNTGCMQCDRRYLSSAWLNENISEGLYVWLEIADTGCGMDKETISKIFDPFFTTKFTGRGLGMAAVLGIVRGHKGAIKLYSEPGRGTTFKVLMPAGDRTKELFDVNDVENEEWKGSGTVLLVDDEETVIGIGSEMLKELGFCVLAAMDGKEAVDVFTQNPHAVTSVILDLTMPHMDGEQTFRELRRIRPDVKVIMSSGYNEQEVTQRFAGKGLAGFIQKPYKLSELAAVLKMVPVIDREGTA